jgi:membrane protease YdiL (CAAX protease family)
MDPGPAARPHAPPAPVRWGLPDVFLAWIVGVMASVIVAAPFLGANGKIPSDEEVVATLVLLAVQNVALIGFLVFVAHRKGLGSLRADFGLAIQARDLLWILGGVLVAIVAGILLLPITELAGLKDSSQEVVKTFEESAGALEKVGVAIGIVLIAPIGEELLFRGALLRSLMRRTSPAVAVNITALIFALVHFVGDPGTGYYVPAFLLLGLLSGWRAAATGRIGQSICLHVGFNLLGAIQILT